MKSLLPFLAALCLAINSQAFGTNLVLTTTEANVTIEKSAQVKAGQLLYFENFSYNVQNFTGISLFLDIDYGNGAVITHEGFVAINTAFRELRPDKIAIAGPATVKVRLVTNPSFVVNFPSPPFASFSLNIVGPDDTFTPSSAVVIPADAPGPVKIVLESSSDLVTWTEAQPGEYGAATQKRFFRVRAIQKN
jgi:hypothetical protein